jgi:hypothetical protein
MHSLKTRQARIERVLAASGESHQNDARRVDSAMSCEHCQCTVCVLGLCKATKLGQVIRCISDATACETVYNKGSNAHHEQFLLPFDDIPRNAAGSVKQNDKRKSVVPARVNRFDCMEIGRL